MRTWMAIASLALLTSLGGIMALAWSQDVGPAVDQSERDRAMRLMLGEELPPPRPEEEQATQILVAGSTDQVAKQQDRPIQRDQHPKNHGCVRATFTVIDGLPESLRVGIFREPR